MALRIREEAAALPVYRPGRRPPLIDGRPAYKLSSNENPYPPLPGGPPLCRDAGLCRAQPLPRHRRSRPDGSPGPATGRRGGERIAFGTGSVAVLFHLLHVLGRPGAEVVYAFRSFEAYPIATQLSGATGVPVPLTPAYEHDLDAMLAAIGTGAPVAVLLCTPEQPDRAGAATGRRRGVPGPGARRRRGGAGRGVRGVRRRPGRGRRALAARSAERGRAADVLQGVRAGGAADRLRGRRRRSWPRCSGRRPTRSG